MCRRHRLTLTELMPIAWQRVTKYQLLVKNILSSYKKHWEELNGGYMYHDCECVLKCCFSFLDADKEEAQQLETAFDCIKVCLFLFYPPQMFSALSQFPISSHVYIIRLQLHIHSHKIHIYTTTCIYTTTYFPSIS